MVHPVRVLRTTAEMPQFESQMERFVDMVRGRKASTAPRRFEFHYFDKVNDLDALIDMILAAPGKKIVAFDGEWEGGHPGEPGSYLRTIQISHKPGFAVAIVLRHAGGEPRFMPGIPAAIKSLQRLIDDPNVRMAGHFFSADYPWLEHEGLKLAHKWLVPGTPEECRDNGPLETGLLAHSAWETGDFKLEHQGVRYCKVHRWDTELKAWLSARKTEDGKKIKEGMDAESINGYGNVPDGILLPYGCYDACITRELVDVYIQPGGLLDKDMYGQSGWVGYHTAMKAFPAFVEMSEIGITLDKERIKDVGRTFTEVQSQIGRAAGLGQMAEVQSTIFAAVSRAVLRGRVQWQAGQGYRSRGAATAG